MPHNESAWSSGCDDSAVWSGSWNDEPYGRHRHHDVSKMQKDFLTQPLTQSSYHYIHAPEKPIRYQVKTGAFFSPTSAQSGDVTVNALTNHPHFIVDRHTKHDVVIDLTDITSYAGSQFGTTGALGGGLGNTSAWPVYPAIFGPTGGTAAGATYIPVPVCTITNKSPHRAFATVDVSKQQALVAVNPKGAFCSVGKNLGIRPSESITLAFLPHLKYWTVLSHTDC